jgi:hypothetical protein
MTGDILQPMELAAIGIKVRLLAVRSPQSGIARLRGLSWNRPRGTAFIQPELAKAGLGELKPLAASVLGQVGAFLENGRRLSVGQDEIRGGLLAILRTDRSAAWGRPLCPRFHSPPADHCIANLCHAGIRYQPDGGVQPFSCPCHPFVRK